MIEIRYIDNAHKQDVRLKNDPFPLWGKMIPSYQNEKWSWEIKKFTAEAVSEMCFPDAKYDYDAMTGNTFFIGAYDSETCIGLAVLEKSFYKYMYLSDLNVQQEYRRKGIGKMLIQAALETAREQNCRGIKLTAQDNNLSACLFYLNCGFRLGGLDTEVYNGTQQEGKFDLQFYFDL